ncbi:hypothetical protein NY96_13415 [Xanthomonas citri pv. fuscans]|uniref:hypothetical protein n=1 Tax=Xanthomonas TaxID=338 RepID=UPI0003671A75|nr:MULTISPECIES: hypothetical protein [Xanthomonas]KGT55139.1 hypothetical protein NY96_13415 [Xanthomonas citri pv. fuscans]
MATSNTRQYRRLPSQLGAKAQKVGRPPWSDRRFAITWLLAPIIGVLLAFLIAVAVTAMGKMAQGTPRFYLVALSYTYLLASLMCMPAYAIGVGGYWWMTRNAEEKRIGYLWWIPVFSALWGWFPSVLFPQGGDVGMGKLFVMMAGTVFVLSLIWILVVRAVLYIWKKV